MPGIKRKKSYGIINYPNPNDVESVRYYCPICASILQKWILDFEQNDNPIKVPNKLQCLACGEIVTIYHPSALS